MFKEVIIIDLDFYGFYYIFTGVVTTLSGMQQPASQIPVMPLQAVPPPPGMEV